MEMLLNSDEEARLKTVNDLRYGKSPKLDAWLLHFMTENNLEYLTNPQKNASPEQLRFMVAIGDDQVYAPCSDRRIPVLLDKEMSADLKREYDEKWLALVELAHAYVGDENARERILELCRFKYKLMQSSPIMIPSRAMKRFLTILLTQSGLKDPYKDKKKLYNKNAYEALKSGIVDDYLNVCPAHNIPCNRLSDLRFELDMLELERMLVISTAQSLWERETFDGGFHLPSDLMIAEGVSTTLHSVFAERQNQRLKILFLPDTSGGLIFDLVIIKALIRQGHSVVLSFKEGFHFASPIYWDWDDDPVLAEMLDGAHFLDDVRITKNALLRTQSQHPLVAITDGTREELNLYRASVTFARAWKEADLIIAKGEPQHRRLIATSQPFTRDILCYHRDHEGRFHLHYKPKAYWVRKFREKDIEHKAGEIIGEMRKAKTRGESVMFYSAIIGSLPGQTKTAIQIIDTFVKYLRERLDRTYVINPAEHFEEGMDADDLMFMWERVQRTGLIDVWRFETVADIEKSFELLGQKVPPIWTGKDSTFSTGCTKEMRIALDMQKKFPEMQIIGPDPARFFRRQEYGVGKFFDSTIE